MITTLSDAKRVPNIVNLANTSFSVLVDGEEKMLKQLESISISCGDTDTDVTLVLTRDGTDYPIMNAVTVVKNTTYMVNEHHIPINKNTRIRIKASNANQITAIAITLDSMIVKLGNIGLGSTLGGF